MKTFILSFLISLTIFYLIISFLAFEINLFHYLDEDINFRLLALICIIGSLSIAGSLGNPKN